MSFLQTVGIASQASDKFDDERQGRRMNSQREQAMQGALDENMLYREIVKMAYQHEYAKEQAAAAKAAAKKAAPPRGAVPTPRMPPAILDTGGQPMMPVPPPPPPMGFADGGTVNHKKERESAYAARENATRKHRDKYFGESTSGIENDDGSMGIDFQQYRKQRPMSAEKYNGIYDDTKATNRLPTIFQEFLEDLKRPGYKHGGMVDQTVGEMMEHFHAFADGGMVDANGVALYAEGGEVVPEGSEEFIDPAVVSAAAAQGAPQLAYRPGPRAYYGETNGLWGGNPGEGIAGPEGTADGIGGVVGGIGMPGGIPGLGPVASMIGSVVASQNMGVTPGDTAAAAVQGDDAAGVAAGTSPVGGGIDGGSHSGVAAADAAAAASSTGVAGDASGDAGDAGWANGGPVSIWKYMQHRMSKSQKPPKTKTKPAAVKFKKGGMVRGPGTGTSDSVKASIGGKHPARLSNGEYVLSADTVRAVGKDKLDALQAKYHKPVRR